jgi:hypothetical protein
VTDPRDERRVAEELGVRFERLDVDAGVVARWAVILGVITVVFAAIAVWLLVFLRRHEEGRDAARPALYFSSETRQPEGVRLQTAPFADIQALRHQEEQILHGYAWVDPAAGVVHIPIEEAMRLYVARQGAAAPQPTTTGPAVAPRAPTDSAPVPGPVTEPAPLPAASPSPAASGPPAPPPPHGAGPPAGQR